LFGRPPTKTYIMRLRILVSLLTVGFVSSCGVGVEADELSVVDDSEVDVNAQAVTASCGANYTPALRKYELAVLVAKSVVARRICESVRNPRDGKYYEASPELVGELMQQSIRTCVAFRAVYKHSPYAEPARQALKNSLLSEVITGRLDTKVFAALQGALIGKKLFGVKPGVANVSQVTFRANGVVDFEMWNPQTGKMELIDGTGWSVQKQGNRLVVRIDIVDGSTFYVPTYDGNHVKLVPVPANPNLVLSTSSEPCSA
jgi:hypothetical protein